MNSNNFVMLIVVVVCSGVWVRPFEATDGGPRLPLPAQTLLYVTYVQRGAWEAVVHTVQTLAPDNKGSVCCPPKWGALAQMWPVNATF
jgi:hypothetical protein